MELGCFVAGVVLSSNGEHLVHQVSINILLTDRNTFLVVNLRICFKSN